MKRILVAVAGLCLVAPASAETAALKVRTSDLDLASPVGVDHLANRLLRQMWAICDKPHVAALSYVNTGGGLEERAACKAQLKVSPDAHPGVKKAFAIALERFG